ncbi:hypothetical protein H0H81_004511 [Sphagnurus paluster]|uniref:peptidyl-tRNA hydrolase n=1 Tax=Sphagnurus paluster TaxID=117069 RepID=A0A9P7FVV9_9AGAR|nr:hypothetical protein H0H81_004511 [Sphagnurus paluster]
MLSTSHRATPIVLATVLSVTSLGIGFHLGAQCNIPPKVQDSIVPTSPTVEDDSEDEQDPESIPDGDLSAIKAGLLEQSRSTLGENWVRDLENSLDFRQPVFRSQAKIALKAKSEDQMLELEAIAKSLDLCARSIRDQ